MSNIPKILKPFHFFCLVPRYQLSEWPGPHRGPVHLLHMPGNICGARIYTLRSQLLQGLPTGLLEPQQEVLVPHVQEELLQKTRDERQPGPGRNILPVPGSGGLWKPLARGLNDYKLRLGPQRPSSAGHRRVRPARRRSMRCLHWKEAEGSEVLRELPWILLRGPFEASQEGPSLHLPLPVVMTTFVHSLTGISFHNSAM